jgi:hypothetical protein
MAGPRDAVDPVQYAFHPSRFANPATIAQAATQPYGTFAQAVKLESARAFVTAMCTDRQGNLWLATEGGGVQKWDPTRPPLDSWTQDTIPNSLFDDYCYAIACDTVGRIWVGHLNHGVSVFNGQKWQNYEVVGGLSRGDTRSGPLGERVFHITVNPKDGDVWIATNYGLSRYSQSKDTWTYYTRSDGLPTDQANSMAFDSAGNIYLATECDGIAMADAGDNYSHWRSVTGPDDEPATPTGEGLPSNLMNDILVTKDGTVYATSDAGLAWSEDRGTSWRYVRGRDYADKVRGRVAGPPSGWSQTAGATLAEDYCTTCAQIAPGRICVGHRAAGQFDLITGAGPSAMPFAGNFATSIVPLSDGRFAAGTYGGGVYACGESLGSPQARVAASTTPVPALPSAAAAPELPFLAAQVNAMNAAGKEQVSLPSIVALQDDWLTQGNWIDRYGNFCAVLFAQAGAYNFVGGYFGAYGSGLLGTGGNHNDSIRYWVAALNTTDIRALQCLQLGGRKQAECNDNGTAFAPAVQGPDLFYTLLLPPGQYIISLYFVNDDGQKSAPNSMRDYQIECRNTPMPDSDFRSLGSGSRSVESRFVAAPPGARARVANFWGGVYKRFYVKTDPSSGVVSLRITRNHSSNTILSGVFVDPAAEMCGELGPYEAPPRPRAAPVVIDTKAAPLDLGDAIAEQLVRTRDSQPLQYAVRSRQLAIGYFRNLLAPTDGPVTCLAAQISLAKRLGDFRKNIATCLADQHISDFYAPVDGGYQTETWRQNSRAAQPTGKPDF